jgi:ABC-type sugar transport system ATPase subunit
MNFIECSRGAGGEIVAGQKLPLTLSNSLQKKLKDFKGDRFIFGIRPEYLYFRRKEEIAGNSFAVRVINVETIQQIRFGNFYIGENLYKCRIEDGGALSGGDGYVTADDEKIRFYDPESGKIL